MFVFTTVSIILDFILYSTPGRFLGLAATVSVYWYWTTSEQEEEDLENLEFWVAVMAALRDIEQEALGAPEAPEAPENPPVARIRPQFVGQHHIQRNSIACRHAFRSSVYRELGDNGKLRWLMTRSMYQCIFDPYCNRADGPQLVGEVPSAYQMFKLAYSGPMEGLYPAYQAEMARDSLASWHAFRRRVVREQDEQVIKGWVIYRRRDNFEDDEGIEADQEGEY